jgi:hypothetical protein
LSPGGRDFGDFEAVANGEALFVSVLIGEDIVGDGPTDRAARGNSRYQQAMGYDDRMRTLSNGDAQGSVLPSVSKGDKTALRVGADEKWQAAELLWSNGGRPLLCQERQPGVMKRLQIERSVLVHLSPPAGLKPVLSLTHFLYYTVLLY